MEYAGCGGLHGALSESLQRLASNSSIDLHPIRRRNARIQQNRRKINGNPTNPHIHQEWLNVCNASLLCSWFFLDDQILSCLLLDNSGIFLKGLRIGTWNKPLNILRLTCSYTLLISISPKRLLALLAAVPFMKICCSLIITSRVLYLDKKKRRKKIM